jgi:hypothetical protein
MISGLKKHWIPGQARNDEQGYGASVNLHHFVPGMSDLFGEFIFMNQSAKIFIILCLACLICSGNLSL